MQSPYFVELGSPHLLDQRTPMPCSWELIRAQLSIKFGPAKLSVFGLAHVAVLKRMSRYRLESRTRANWTSTPGMYVARVCTPCPSDHLLVVPTDQFFLHTAKCKSYRDLCSRTSAFSSLFSQSIVQQARRDFQVSRNYLYFIIG